MWAGMEKLRAHDKPNEAQARWWTNDAAAYHEEHGSVLGTDTFVWGPEGLTEEEAKVLGDVQDMSILEIGAGGAQCSRYLQAQGARVIATDISEGMLNQALLMNSSSPTPVPLAVADACSLPFADGTFDAVVTSFGAIAFVENLTLIFKETARVTRPGGFIAYSAPHPVRWMFPDSPYAQDMTVTTSYFSDEAYVERDDSGTLQYCEHHHTFEDHVRSLAAAGYTVEDMREPRWPEGRTITWGGWGPERSPWIPGTLIVRAGLKA